MKLVLEKTSRLPRWPAGAVVAGGIWLILVAGNILLSLCSGKTVDLCFLHRLTGLPCPTCGTGRGIIRIFSGDIFQGLLSNPFVVVTLVFFSLLFIIRLVTSRSPRLMITTRGKAGLLALLAVLFAVNWGYLIVSQVLLS